MADSAGFPGSAFPVEGKGGGRACSLSLEAGGLRVTTADGDEAQWEYRDLEFRAGGDEGRYLIVVPRRQAGSIGSVAVLDAAFDVALAGRVPGRQREFLLRFRRKSAGSVFRKWRNLCFAVVAAAGVVAGGYRLIMGGLADYAAGHLPLDVEVKWGESIVEGYLSGKETVRSGPAFSAARDILGRLTSSLADPEPYPFELNLVRDETVNAFALPGGQMVLLTGLMAQASSPEEVAGVLAHEIQHVRKRHVVKRLLQRTGWRVWILLIFRSSEIADVAFGAGQLVELSYGRAQETEADVEAAKLLASAGVRIEPLADFFDRLDRRGSPGPLPAILSTHPASSKRSKELRALAGTLSPAHPRGFPGIDWDRVREAAGER